MGLLDLEDRLERLDLLALQVLEDNPDLLDLLDQQDLMANQDPLDLPVQEVTVESLEMLALQVAKDQQDLLVREERLAPPDLQEVEDNLGLMEHQEHLENKVRIIHLYKYKYV